MAFLKQIFSKQWSYTNLLCAETALNQINRPILIRHSSHLTREYDESKDPRPVFIKKEVQSLLRQLTRVDLQKVYRKRKLAQARPSPPEYKFMTSEQLEAAMEEAWKRADKLLQIPPIVPARKPINVTLSEDPALQGLETSTKTRLVFTDISYGIENADRLIVVRENDGRLTKADWDVRDRMNQTYFPAVHRTLRPSKMFEEEHLARVLERQEYEFVLDRACVQFEPDDGLYQKIVAITYCHVNENNAFEKLRSTRHFGGLAFYLAWNKCIDNLLLDLIETLNIEEAKAAILLYGEINNVAFEASAEHSDEFAIVKKFIEEYSQKKGALELALQSCKEALKEKQELSQGIRRAHCSV